jgi:hypothetical protein
VITNLCASSYHWAISNARILKPSSLSYIPSKFQTRFPCHRLFTVPARNFGEHNLSYEQWVSVLHLSSLWGFASLRKLALKSIQPPNACEKLLLARTYGVDNWALSALSSLCERKQPIGLEEARRMTIEDIVLVATVREEIRLNGFRVKTARIPGVVEAAQAGISVYIANEDVVPVVPEKDITEDSSKQAAAGSSIEGDSYDRTKEAAVATPSEKGHGNRRGSHEHLVSPVRCGWDGVVDKTPCTMAKASTTAETQEEKIGRTYDQPPTPTPAPKVTSENEVDGWPALPVNTKKGEGVNKAYRVFRSGIGSTKTFVRAKSDTHLEVNTANGVMQGGIS